ncbi:hypothetical protein L1887_05015 [Cichorium endivia]|nr:hypothetical protein L1887_05015 [Cichorium endivia]
MSTLLYHNPPPPPPSPLFTIFRRHVSFLSQIPRTKFLSQSHNQYQRHRLYATPSRTAVPAPAQASEEIKAGRLEPRVEKKGGYFVPKEKFRQGINPQENVKIAAEPVKLFMENGI